MLVDSHCHLDRLDLSNHEGKLSRALQSARDQGIEHFLSVSVILEEFPRLQAIADEFPFVSLSLGLHPTEQGIPEPSLETLVKLAAHPRVVAIGETGLDYYRIEGDLLWQQERFRRHIQAARQMQKPLIIHTRQAREDTIRIMKEEGADKIGGVMHCFTEDLAMAEAAIALNFYISISGIVTFKNAVDLQNVVRAIPLEHLLIETDSPYLAPMPFRGKPNEPAYVKYVAAAIADLKNVSIETVGRVTTENFYRLFSMAPRHC